MTEKEKADLLNKIMAENPLARQMFDMAIDMKNDMLAALEKPGQTITMNGSPMIYGERFGKPTNKT